ncbi:hypothetical protein RESH_00741 [Rhodopirellula europaea SH398]|uniref:Uncharacterized protein n=1 Tax=Rhodopirellula europaea SH398 TaxID=1263868 RepID=M5SB15_9BACT|nr:hypothetical protein RESH_00741 [Rhodopirellula europaea SH398]
MPSKIASIIGIGDCDAIGERKLRWIYNRDCRRKESFHDTRPERSERCLNYEKLHQGQPALPK